VRVYSLSKKFILWQVYSHLKALYLSFYRVGKLILVGMRVKRRKNHKTLRSPKMLIKVNTLKC